MFNNDIVRLIRFVSSFEVRLWNKLSLILISALSDMCMVQILGTTVPEYE
jgi:hypothetical protein